MKCAEASRAPVTAAAMPCSCFGKKDKKAGAGGEKYSLSPEQEPLSTQTPAPAQAQAPAPAPAPAQTESAPATPPTPVTPTSDDPRLRPEDDPDKASRRRDVVASFYNDQCELIGFKATGSRPPSAVVGQNPAATSSPLSSPPSSSRASALSRADLALKRREFFKDLAVNDLNSSRYRASQPSWRMVESGSLTTPRRTHQDGPQHHTLPFHARAGGVVLRPISTPSKATSGPDLHIATNGDSINYTTDDAKGPEAEPLLGAGDHQESVSYHQEAGAEEPPLSCQQSEWNQPIPVPPVTPPVTPATPPPTPPVRAEPLDPEIPSHGQPLASDTLIELAATHLEESILPPQREDGQLVVQQQYVQQVSVPSDDERLAEGSCILIKEAFPDEPRSHRQTSSHDDSDSDSASGIPATPPATHEAVRDVPQHSSEQPTMPPPTDIPSQRRPSLPEEEEEEEEELPRYTDEAALDTDQHFRRPASSPNSSPPGSPQQPRRPSMGESVVTADHEHHQHHDPPRLQQECGDGSEEMRLSPTIVGCIPKVGPTHEGESRSPSPPQTPPAVHPSSPPAGEETSPPAPPTHPSIEDRAPPSPPTPPSLSDPRVTCGVDASSSPLEDDGLGSDIDDALSSLECLTEEGNNEKRATAST